MDRYIDFFCKLIVLLILLRIVLSWRKDKFGDLLGRWVYLLTEPIMRVFRLAIDTRGFGFDLSPVLALVFFWLLRELLIFLF